MSEAIKLTLHRDKLCSYFYERHKNEIHSLYLQDFRIISHDFEYHLKTRGPWSTMAHLSEQL